MNCAFATTEKRRDAKKRRSSGASAANDGNMAGPRPEETLSRFGVVFVVNIFSEVRFVDHSEALRQDRRAPDSIPRASAREGAATNMQHDSSDNVIPWRPKGPWVSLSAVLFVAITRRKEILRDAKLSSLFIQPSGSWATLCKHCFPCPESTFHPEKGYDNPDV
ncbi:unnamed protein product [Notodromas monacha]|uniref:Uncharacterized protein n=1 Tax=Notodromas monacha TaxID=399045 RepID=A0A7R9BE69_9CRUS|nr:unnamed protein product [Notodromas monacha]CAG0913172.1 unnamed protein product [Notodromas monacha]